MENLEEQTGKVLLASPAKIGGKVWQAGTTPEVTAVIALQLAEAGAIEITSSDIAKLKEALATAGRASTENIGEIVAAMKADTDNNLKTSAGNWSAAAISKALGREVTAQEVKTAAAAAELTAGD